MNHGMAFYILNVSNIERHLTSNASEQQEYRKLNVSNNIEHFKGIGKTEDARGIAVIH